MRNEIKFLVEIFKKLSVIIVLKAFVLMFAWNNSMVYMFSLPELEFMPSIAMMVVATLLFNSHRLMFIQLMLQDMHALTLRKEMHRGKKQMRDNGLPPTNFTTKDKKTKKRKSFDD